MHQDNQSPLVRPIGLLSKFVNPQFGTKATNRSRRRNDWNIRCISAIANKPIPQSKKLRERYFLGQD
jgi:hypothetical protein